MLGGNLGSLLYDDVSVMVSTLKVTLTGYPKPLYHWKFSTRWIEKKSEIGLFLYIGLACQEKGLLGCRICDVIRWSCGRLGRANRLVRLVVILDQ